MCMTQYRLMRQPVWIRKVRPTQRASLRVVEALSQTARQSLPHRPWHLNSFERPPICPPHSGQTKFRIADMYSALMPVNAALINCIHTSQQKLAADRESMAGID